MELTSVTVPVFPRVHDVKNRWSAIRAKPGLLALLKCLVSISVGMIKDGNRYTDGAALDIDFACHDQLLPDPGARPLRVVNQTLDIILAQPST